MPDVGGALTKKAGGLPRWAWGAGLVGAIGVGLYLRSKSSAASTAGTSTATTADTTGAGTTDTTGLAAGSPDLSGLATADQIAALQTTLSDLPSEIAGVVGTQPPPDTSGGPPIINITVPPNNPVPPTKKTPTKKPHKAVKPKVNKAHGRTPPKRHPKPTPAPVKKAHRVTSRLRPKAKPHKPAPPATTHTHNTATDKAIAGHKAASQNTHRAATRSPAHPPARSAPTRKPAPKKRAVIRRVIPKKKARK